MDTPQAAEAVAGLLPRLAAGRVLVTSRLTDWSGSFQALELDMLSEQDAADFLLERTHGRRRAAAADEADALALAKELGGLALAVGPLEQEIRGVFFAEHVEFEGLEAAAPVGEARGDEHPPGGELGEQAGDGFGGLGRVHVVENEQPAGMFG